MGTYRMMPGDVDTHGQRRLVAHTTDSLHARQGGPPRTISALATGLGQLGAEVTVFALADGAPEEAVVPDPDVARTRFVERGRGGGGQLRGELISESPELIHDHGLWLPSNHAAAVAAARLRVPRVVSTRGMLEPWARQHRRWKKALAWLAFQRRDLHASAALHATAASEAANLRDLGLRQPIAVIPNGVSVPGDLAAHDKEERGAPRRALFLSRIHPKKGLPLLLDVWAALALKGWELIIAGPDEGGHRAELETQAIRLGLQNVQFEGEVTDVEKWSLYRSADLFVLPTYSENFGVVVAEALATGVPVVTTTGAPWADLESRRCGWWVTPTFDSLRGALQVATAASDTERRAMGGRGRTLVEERYAWETIAAQMLAVYEWLLSPRSAVPSTVSLS